MNPFGRLNVGRDASDDEEIIDDIKTKENAIQVEERKKRKVRPATEKMHEDDQGFEVVKKGKKTLDFEEPVSNETGQKPKHKVAYMYRGDAVPAKKGKRLYDRHSGTGRGKEVAKGGAGGLHTWGDNLKTISHEVIKHLDDPTIEGDYEEESNVL